MTLEALFLTLLNRSLAAGWLVLALLLLRPLMRKVSRTLCCAMWCLVAIRLVCPFSIRSVLSLIPRVQPIPMELAELPTSAVGEGTVGALSNAPPIDAEPLASSMQMFIRGAAVMWLTGVALFGLYAVLSYLRLRRRVSDAVRQEDGVWMSDWIKYPFVLGVFRPRVLVPFETDGCDLPYILAHERAHLARRDHWRKPIAFVLLAIFWFQPILWVAYFLLCRDIEFACDERALRSLGVELESKKLYAKALLRGNASRVSILACPLAFGGLQVKKRVKYVLTYRKPAVSLLLTVAILCCAVAVCFLTDPKLGAGALGAENDPVETEETSSASPEAEPLPAVINECEYIGRYIKHWFIQDDNDGAILVVENSGTEDGSFTISVELGERHNFSEPVTIPVPAGLRVMYAIDESKGVIRGYSTVGMSYGDVVWLNEQFAPAK